VAFISLLIPYDDAAGTILPQLGAGNTMYGKLRTEINLFLGFQPYPVLVEGIMLVQFCG
jgi:hypothetical protein